MRILLDTNVIISGFISPNGPPARLLRHWLEGRFELVTSERQLVELKRALGYEKLRQRASVEQQRDFLENVAALAHLARGGGRLGLSDDPDDDAILANAIEGKANLIVSGDRPGMLALKEVRGVFILTAREALSRFARNDS